MPIPLPEYWKIKDRVLVSYQGNCREYPIILSRLREYIESGLSGLSVYLSFRDECCAIPNQFVIPGSELRRRKNEFGFICEIEGDGRSHPIENFLDENGIVLPQLHCDPPSGGKCLVVDRGIHPTADAHGELLDLAIDHARNLGLGCVFGEKLDYGISMVVGVESPALYEAAFRGLPTALMPTGVGAGLFRRLFPSSKILQRDRI